MRKREVHDEENRLPTALERKSPDAIHDQMPIAPFSVSICTSVRAGAVSAADWQLVHTLDEFGEGKY